MRLPWGRYLNLAQAWVLDGATRESREEFMAGLWDQYGKAEAAVRLAELTEVAVAEGRELTTRERLLRARPDWDSPARVAGTQLAAAQLSQMKTKAQHRARAVAESAVQVEGVDDGE